MFLEAFVPYEEEENENLKKKTFISYAFFFKDSSSYEIFAQLFLCKK